MKFDEWLEKNYGSRFPPLAEVAEKWAEKRFQDTVHQMLVRGDMADSVTNVEEAWRATRN